MDTLHMHDHNEEWIRSRDSLIRTLKTLGFPEDLGHAIAGHLGSPKAINRMTAYLQYVRPGTVELVVDEMLAIRSEIDAWREKKANEEANEAYNRILYEGLGTEEEAYGNVAFEEPETEEGMCDSSHFEDPEMMKECRSQERAAFYEKIFDELCAAVNAESEASAEVTGIPADEPENTKEAQKTVEPGKTDEPEKTDEAQKAVESARIVELKKKAKLLEKYYTSGEWQIDYEADEAGKFPADMKRGVLSQDGVYDLLEKWKEWEEQVHEDTVFKDPDSAE